MGVCNDSTYGLVVNTVDLGVEVLRGDLTVSGQVVLDLANLQDSSLLESPGCQLLSELAVDGRDLLAARSLDRSGEPLVLKSLNGSQNSEASRVASLESRHDVQLGTSGLNLVRRWHLLLRVVRVSGGRSFQNRGKKLAVTTQGLGSNSGESENTLAIKEGLDIRTKGTGALEEEDIVLLGGREGIVVEVVNDNSGAVVGEVDVDFEEKGADGTGGRSLAGEGENNVAVLVEEVQDVLGSQ